MNLLKIIMLNFKLLSAIITNLLYINNGYVFYYF